MLSLHMLYSFLRDKLIQLNLFYSKSADPIVVRREILSTRLFLLLFFIAILILSIYTSLSVQIKNEIVDRPTLSEYEQLEQKYPDTLECPCTKISIPYIDFVDINASFHQVCSSNFISQLWIDFTFDIDRALIWPMDVRTSLSSMWQLLAALCQQSITMFVDALDDFRDLPLVSGTLLSPILLDPKAQAALDLLRQTALDSLVRPLKSVYLIALASDYMTGVSTNYIASATQSTNSENGTALVSMTSTSYIQPGSTEPCYCQKNGSCLMIGGLYLYDKWETRGVYDLNNIVPNETLPGLTVDCLPMQMTFTSTLECFYNQSCLTKLLSSYSAPFDPMILNLHAQTRFSPNTPIQTLIEELFIENILNQTNYTSYYLSCAPISCSYTYARRFDWIYMVTTIVTLFGGLNVLLRFFSPYVIRLCFFLKTKCRQNPKKIPQIQPASNRFNLKTLFVGVVQNAIVFNLFTLHSRDPVQMRRGRLASRLYLATVIVGGIVLTIYTSTSIRTFQETIPLPTQIQYESLQLQHSTTLQCPCSTLSIPYEDIIRIEPSFHQICSSDFVQPWWYQKLDLLELSYDSNEYFISINAYFRILAALCELANITTRESIRRFYSNTYVNAYMLPSTRFSLEIHNIILGFLNSTVNEFSNSRALIGAVLQANQFVRGSAMQNAFVVMFDFSFFFSNDQEPIRISSVDLSMSPNGSQDCFCARKEACGWEELNQMLRTCSSMMGAVVGSLEYLYSRDWFEMFEKSFPDKTYRFPLNTTLLDSTLPSRFAINATLMYIADELMIEKWNPTHYFADFHRKCRPIYCSFVYQARPNIFFIVSTVIGIIGGLSQLLRLMCTVVMMIVVRRRETIYPPHRGRQLWSIFVWIRGKIVTFNLFNDESAQMHNLTRERASTWLYLFLLTISLSGVAIYTALITESATGHVTVSSLQQYERLASSHLNALQCPCSRISVPYEILITINISSHQICSSDFVEDPWLDFLFDDANWAFHHRSDVRIRGAAYFGLLSALCRLSKITIHNALKQFLNETFVSSQMISEREFRSKINLVLNQFEKTTSEKFTSLLRLLSSITHANTFISTYLLNWNWTAPADNTVQQLRTRAVELDDGCSCGTRSDCKAPGGVFFFLFDGADWYIPGFHIGCSSVETLLHSTLECFYNQTCVDHMIIRATDVWIALSGTSHAQALDPTSLSHFQLDASIRHLAEVLFTEDWSTNVSYSAFYQKCAPSSCSYTFEKQNNVIHIFSRILGLVGGLSVILSFFTPRVVNLIMNTWNRRRVTVVAPCN